MLAINSEGSRRQLMWELNSQARLKQLDFKILDKR